MQEIIIPRQDANSTEAVIRDWHAKKGDAVHKNQVVVTVETSKSIVEIEAPCAGVLLPLYEAGASAPFLAAVALIAEEGESLEDVEKSTSSTKDIAQAKVKATKKAIKLAESRGVDLEQIAKKGVITERDVLAFAGDDGSDRAALAKKFVGPADYPPGMNRVLIVGGGNALTQIMSIFVHHPEIRVVGCVDDSTAFPTDRPFEVPLLGKLDDVQRLFDDGQFDSALISISSVLSLREALYKKVKDIGIPLCNAIHPTVVIDRHCSIGVGNIIGALTHIGSYCSIGDNNLISAHSNLDHQNVWGSHNTVGPNCTFSGRVKVGDRVKFGTGVFAENLLEIGGDSVVSSGAILTTSIPEFSSVKTTVSQTVVSRKGSK